MQITAQTAKTIADKILRHREKEGLTQQQMAALVRCSQSTIVRLETGSQRSILYSLCRKISVAMDTTIEELTDGVFKDRDLPDDGRTEILYKIHEALDGMERGELYGVEAYVNKVIARRGA